MVDVEDLYDTTPVTLSALFKAIGGIPGVPSPFSVHSISQVHLPRPGGRSASQQGLWRFNAPLRWVRAPTATV